MLAPDQLALTLLLLPLACTVVNAVSFIIVSHVFGLNHLLGLIVSFALGLTALAGAGVTLWSHSPLHGLEMGSFLSLAALSYGALGYGYFTVVCLTASSLRIRALRHIHNSPDQGVTSESLRAIYGATDLLELRLERLAQWGQITRRGGRVYVSGQPGFLLLALAVKFLRRFLLPLPRG